MQDSSGLTNWEHPCRLASCKPWHRPGWPEYGTANWAGMVSKGGNADLLRSRLVEVQDVLQKRFAETAAVTRWLCAIERGDKNLGLHLQFTGEFVYSHSKEASTALKQYLRWLCLREKMDIKGLKFQCWPHDAGQTELAMFGYVLKDNGKVAHHESASSVIE